MENKNKILARTILIMLMFSLSMAFSYNVAFAQDEPPEIDAPEFGDDDDEPPALTGEEPEAQTCLFAPTGTEYTVGQSFVHENQTCTCTADGVVCTYDEEPPPPPEPEPEPPAPAPPAPSPTISETGPAVGLLILPSLLLGWAYSRRKQK